MFSFRGRVIIEGPRGARPSLAPAGGRVGRPLTGVPRQTTHEIGGAGRRLEGARVGEKVASGSPPVPRAQQMKTGGIQKAGRLRAATAGDWTAKGQKGKTYNSGYSHVVTHRTTSPPVRSLSSGERTGSSVLCDLWSYVLGRPRNGNIYLPTWRRTWAAFAITGRELQSWADPYLAPGRTPAGSPRRRAGGGGTLQRPPARRSGLRRPPAGSGGRHGGA